jgi:hypothetical protein
MSLIARSVHDPSAHPCSVNDWRVWEASGALSAKDRALVNALGVSDDPASLYESYRRGLFRVGSSDVARSSLVLSVQLGKIAAQPAEDIFLLWWPVLQRVAGWIGEWRTGNPGWDLIRLRGTIGATRSWPVLRRELAEAIRRQESSRRLEPARLAWSA